MRSIIRSILPSIIGLLLLILYGTILFSLFEGINYFDSFYWTITVLSTVGFGDITPSTLYGKIVFMTLVLFGLSLFGYFITVVTSIITERRLLSALLSTVFVYSGKLKNHILLMGWDNYVRYAYDEVVSNGYTPVIVVDDEELGKRLAREGLNTIVASIKEEDFGKRVNIDKAIATIVSESDPSRSILMILRLKRIRKDIPIIALYYNEEFVDVLKQAGADKLINIAEVGGRLLANMVFEPYAAETALDLLSRGGLDIIEVSISSRHDGRTIDELRLMGLRSDIIMIIRDEDVYYKPENGFRLAENDKIVLLGITETLDRDKELLER